MMALARPRRTVVLLVLTVIVLAGTIAFFGPGLVATGQDGPIANPTDFRAFYCGGAALVAGHDPYRVEPLMDCEAAAVAHFGLQMIPNMVLPAPLPPFALAFFALFALLPFEAASIAWFVIGLGAVLGTVVIVRRLSGAPIWAVAGACLAADAYASMVIGQIVPIVVFALGAAALALRADRRSIAAAALAVTMLEPHVGLPALVAVFVARRSMRLPLTIACVALAAVSFAVAGPQFNVEYARDVLPAHARSEIHSPGAQYSLSSLVAAFGVGVDAAVRLGELWYAAMLVAGVAIAARCTRISGDPAFLVLLPPALGVFGGVFVHIHQMAAALPVAFLLVRDLRGLPRAALLMATFALAVPWETIAESPAVVAAYNAGYPMQHYALAAPNPDALAEVAEDAYIRAGGSYHDGRSLPVMILWKLPTWLALVVIGIVAAAAPLPRRAQR